MPDKPPPRLCCYIPYIVVPAGGTSRSAPTKGTAHLKYWTVRMYTGALWKGLDAHRHVAIVLQNELKKQVPRVGKGGVARRLVGGVEGVRPLHILHSPLAQHMLC